MQFPQIWMAEQSKIDFWPRVLHPLFLGEHENAEENYEIPTYRLGSQAQDACVRIVSKHQALKST